MRVGIQGWGSEGDLRPLVALAVRLKQRGHQPVLVLSPVDGKDYRTPCEQLGIPLKRVPEVSPVSLAELADAEKTGKLSKILGALVRRTFDPYVEEMYAAALELADSTDVLVGHYSCWYTKAASLAKQRPLAMLAYYPGIVPTRHAPPPGLPDWRWLNRPGWLLLQGVLDLVFKKPVAKFFREKGLPPVRHTLEGAMLSDQLNLFAASPSLFPRPPDWSDAHCITGSFWMPEAQEPWSPSPELQRFLEEGPAPVLFSLGSMEHLAVQRARALQLASARAAGVRAIIQTKQSGAAEARAGDVFFLPWAPHHGLIDRCAAVVHHGGAGTTHAVLRAGRPAVVLPFIFEQTMWARQLAKVGAGTSPLSFWKATPEQVGQRIQQALTSEALRRTAAELGRRVAAEDGTAVAIDRLERLHATGGQAGALGG